MGNAIIIPLLLFLTVNSLLLDIVVFSAYRQDRESVSVTKNPEEYAGISETQIDVLGETNIAGSNSREYHVFLGSGTTQSDSWVDIPESEVTINGSRYSGLEQAHLEAYLVVTNGIGRAYMKLYNVSAKHDVWFSEISTESDIPVKVSLPITLDKGAQSYRLMAKSTIRSRMNIHNARIRILTK